MREWLSLADLAALSLPGLPETREGWARISKKQDWRRRKDHRGRPLARIRTGYCGGGVEYHISLLPAVALLTYVARNVGRDVERNGCDDSRRFIVECAERIARYGFSQRFSDWIIAGLYSLGRVYAPPAVVQEIPKVAASTISAWRTKVRCEDAEIRQALECAWRHAPSKVRAAFFDAHCSGAGA